MSYKNTVVTDPGCIGYWGLEETAGSTVNDSSGQAHNMTLTNPGQVTRNVASLLPGGQGKCYDFLGTTAQPEMSSAAWMSVTALTVAAWIQCDSVTGYRCITGHDNVNTSLRNFNWYVQNGKLMFHPVGWNLTEFSTAAAINTGTTYHVAATVSTSGQLKMFINGVQDANVHTTGAPVLNNNAGSATIGFSRAGTGAVNFPFDGRMDEVSWHSEEKSAARIAAWYAAGSETFDAAYWGRRVA